MTQSCLQKNVVLRHAILCDVGNARLCYAITCYVVLILCYDMQLHELCCQCYVMLRVWYVMLRYVFVMICGVMFWYVMFCHVFVSYVML